MVIAILVDVPELPKRIDNVEIIAKISDDVLRTSAQTVIEES